MTEGLDRWITRRQFTQSLLMGGVVCVGMGLVGCDPAPPDSKQPAAENPVATGGSDGGHGSDNASGASSGSSDHSEGAPVSGQDVSWLFEEQPIDIDGRAYAMSSLKATQLIVLNVWATWCGPCVREMPELARMAQDYSDRGVVILGILLDAQDGQGRPDEAVVEEAKQIMQEAGVQYVSILPTGTMNTQMLDTIQYIPTTVLISPQGVVFDTMVGSNDYSSFKEAVDTALAGAAG